MSNTIELCDRTFPEQPKDGEVSYTVDVPLSDGGHLRLHLGQHGRDTLLRLIVSDLVGLDDVCSESVRDAADVFLTQGVALLAGIFVQERPTERARTLCLLINALATRMSLEPESQTTRLLVESLRAAGYHAQELYEEAITHDAGK